MAKKPLRLLVAHAGIYQNTLVSALQQKATHGPSASVLGVAFQHGIPNGFWNHSKHGTSI
jgi:hypothetical protein